ncbi:MAG TPA: S4 domain-containing protein, partial [Candidatus Polarisedimenticolaceae bacterium]|nr:S4 domain-containing protein [Candidatus Polarisedimenticolaceae bacterium]
GPDGRKMSTSWGNAIYITTEPNDLYGRIMRINDELIAQYYRICTDIDEAVIESAVSDIAAGANPRDTKASLAREIVRIYHNDEAALAAEDAFNRQFRDKQLPDDIEEQQVTKSAWEPTQLLIGLGLADSNSAARRLIEQGGVRLNDEKIDGSDLKIKSGDIIRVGKRRFVRLTVK